MNPKENLIRVINFEQPDHIPWFMTMKPDDPYDEGSFQRLPYKGAFPPQEGEQDIWGIEWQATNTELILPYPIMHPLEDINNLENYLWPDPENQALMEPVLHEMDSSRLMLGTHGLTLMERAHSITGMEALFRILASNKEKARQLLRKIADFQIRMAENFVSLGVDGAWCSDDYGAQNSMLISPVMFREFFKPLLSEIFQVYKRAGLFVFFHSCGHIEPIVPDIIEIGADVLHPVQMRSNDQERLKRDFGDQIVFAGGMDTQYTLTQGSPDEVRVEAIKQMQILGREGGYIAGPENWPPFPVQNAKAFAETMSKYGRYPLQPNMESIARTR